MLRIVMLNVIMLSVMVPFYSTGEMFVATKRSSLPKCFLDFLELKTNYGLHTGGHAKQKG
jgi:hypothetical protein